ncbi:hypothetical protein [Salinigranum salinum]|uniref:hypothetical protein n=1 Tax=Salinigranum salinum TaxID=1364937 RepID=UPI001261214D|nr:hypothetical protein [Salinigranum salinum]
MALPRRGLLALVATGLAGCGGFAGGGGGEGEPDGDGNQVARRTTTRRTNAPATPTGPPVSPQSISIGNTHATTEFVTVAVEFAGETVFVESRELVSGERHTLEDVLATGGTYDVVVETADGDRTTYRWDVIAELDGLAVTLADGIDVVRTVRCEPGVDCAVEAGGDRLDAPLVGDGTGRWYAPAQVVLTNPGPPTEATLAVSLFGRTLLDVRYRIERETQIVVPLTYRSGTYRVVVETPDGRVDDDWHVPEEPSQVVDVSTLDVGCGPANTAMRVENRDDATHVVDVGVERNGVERFAGRYALDPGERREVVPVSDSGRYVVRLRVDGGAEETRTWWSCPPQGPVTVTVDGTGGVAFGRPGR